MPTALTALAAAAVVYLAMARMSAEVNSIDRSGVAHVVEVLIDESLAQIGTAATEFAAWDDTYKAVAGTIDDAFVDANLRFPTESGRFFTTLALLDADGTVLRAFRQGKVLAPGGDGISRGDIAALIAAETAKPHRSATGHVQTRLGPLDAGLHRVEPQSRLADVKLPVRYLLVGRPIDTLRLARLADALGVTHLTFGPAPTGADTMALTSASGVRLGAIGWEPRGAGTEAMARVRVPVIGVLSLLFVVMGFLVVTIWKMLSVLRADETEARRAAGHDILSGLPNRASFQTTLEARHATAEGRIAVLFADLDGFKDVNDTHGHDVGDRLIRAVAAGFRALVDGDGVLARLGGDEFSVVLVGADAEARALAVGLSFVDFLGEAFDFEGRTVKVGCSIGIAGSLDEVSTPGELVRRADVAMYVAKAKGKNRVEIYTHDMDADRKVRAELARALQDALLSDGLQVHYQPVISAKTGNISAVEALIRWIRPGAGPVSPAVFLAVAEEAGMTDLLGKFVLRRVAHDARSFGDLKVVVNVFAAQFRDPLFADALAAILEEEGLPPERLELDITESFLVAEPERARRTIEALHDIGVSVALDDFGTGFSSVAYLRRFAFDKVKIDRSVVIDVIKDPASLRLVEAAVALADTLGAVVTAEGIEMEEEAEALTRAGCHELQGYYFGSPTVHSEILRRLTREGQRGGQTRDDQKSA